MASVVVGSIQVCFTAVAALIIDKTGRKVLLYVSGKITYWLLFHEKKYVEYQKVLETTGGTECYNLFISSALFYKWITTDVINADS